jgi:hypothetical protein
VNRRGTHALALIAAAAAITGSGTALAHPAPPSAAAVAHALNESPASGQIELAGNGQVVLQVLRLTDRDGDATAYVAGRPVEFNRRGRAVVRGAAGVVFASGSALTFQVGGAPIELSAAGLGRVVLRGYGRVRLNLGPERAWPRAVIRLAPGRASRAQQRPITPVRYRAR